MLDNNLPIIGSIELVDVCGRKGIPAKIDTGADSSAIWATKIKVTEDGTLKFKLFGPNSPYYNGKVIKRKDYKVAVIRSATGQEQIRYRTHFTIKLGGKKIRVLLNLSDRKNNNFPILIGRRSISKKFLVDVSKTAAKRPPKNPATKKGFRYFESLCFRHDTYSGSSRPSFFQE